MATDAEQFRRLDDGLRSGGWLVRETTWVQPRGALVVHEAGATQPQRDAAAAYVAAFDWTDEVAYAAWLATRDRPAAVARMDAVDELAKVFKAFCGVIADELNILRGQVIGVATLAWDPASIANGAGLTSPNITVAGAAFRDAVDVGGPVTLAGLVATAYVSAPDTVVIRLHNGTGGAVNLANGTWGVCVRRPAAMAPRTLLQAKNAIIAKLNSGDAD